MTEETKSVPAEEAPFVLKPMTIAQQIQRYVIMRDAKNNAADVFNNFVKQNFTRELDALENAMLEQLNTLGVDNVKSEFGTVYKKISDSCTVADGREFQRHVIGGENWGLIDFRVSKTAVKELLDKHEPLPPGVNYTTFQTVGIRRK